MEILTLLNPSTINPDSTGGLPELTAADVSACLAGANTNGTELLLNRVAGLRVSEKALFISLFVDTLRIMRRNGHKLTNKKAKRVEQLLAIALHEHLSGQICPSCKGTKYSLIDPSKPCSTCRGTGKYRLSDAQRSQILGIKKQSWPHWRDIYTDIEVLLQTREYQVIKKLRKMLKND
jgi:hypothetical protein